jgi:transposase, IS30 family
VSCAATWTRPAGSTGPSPPSAWPRHDGHDRRGKLIRDPVLAEFVQRLEQRWSPEQISQALRGQFPGQPHRHLVPETICQAVYQPTRGGLTRQLPRRVPRTGRPRRKPRRRPDARRPGRLVDMTMIDQRPAEVADRITPGHWGRQSCDAKCRTL